MRRPAGRQRCSHRCADGATPSLYRPSQRDATRRVTAQRVHGAGTASRSPRSAAMERASDPACGAPTGAHRRTGPFSDCTRRAARPRRPDPRDQDLSSPTSVFSHDGELRRARSKRCSSADGVTFSVSAEDGGSAQLRQTPEVHQAQPPTQRCSSSSPRAAWRQATATRSPRRTCALEVSTFGLRAHPATIRFAATATTPRGPAPARSQRATLLQRRPGPPLLRGRADLLGASSAPTTAGFDASPGRGKTSTSTTDAWRPARPVDATRAC